MTNFNVINEKETNEPFVYDFFNGDVSPLQLSISTTATKREDEIINNSDSTQIFDDCVRDIWNYLTN